MPSDEMSMGGNLAVVELKACSASPKAMRVDINRLSWFVMNRQVTTVLYFWCTDNAPSFTRDSSLVES